MAARPPIITYRATSVIAHLPLELSRVHASGHLSFYPTFFCYTPRRQTSAFPHDLPSLRCARHRPQLDRSVCASDWRADDRSDELRRVRRRLSDEHQRRHAAAGAEVCAPHSRWRGSGRRLRARVPGARGYRDALHSTQAEASNERGHPDDPTAGSISADLLSRRLRRSRADVRRRACGARRGQRDRRRQRHGADARAVEVGHGVCSRRGESGRPRGLPRSRLPAGPVGESCRFRADGAAPVGSIVNRRRDRGRGDCCGGRRRSGARDRPVAADRTGDVDREARRRRGDDLHSRIASRVRFRRSRSRC